MPRRADRLDQRGQPFDLVAGEPGGGFVEQQEIRLQHQRARDLDEAQFAVLQAVGADIGQRFQPDHAEQRARLGAEHALVAPVARQRQQRLDERRLPSMVPPIMTFSSTEASPITRGVWKVRAMPRAARSAGMPGGSASLAERHRAGLGGVIAGDHVQRRGLAAAVGADQAVDLAGLDVEIEAVDGAHIAEAQRDAAQAQRPAAACSCARYRPSAAGRGTMARLLASGRRLRKSSSAAMPPGIDQHDHQQQHRVEEGRPRRQRCGDLRQDGQDDGAEHRAQDRAAAADQDRDEEQHRQIEGEGVRRDVGLQAREQSAGDRRQRAGEQEDRDQHARLGNAGGFRRDLGVADRDQGAAEPAVGDIGAHPGAEGGKARCRDNRSPRRY